MQRTPELRGLSRLRKALAKEKKVAASCCMQVVQPMEFVGREHPISMGSIGGGHHDEPRIFEYASSTSFATSISVTMMI